ncbi:hypothetical protein AB0E75_04045 [Streptomyces griseoviridis]|uniref:PE-PGRS family protein n=1 Tax=Streptomyces griseoviridis TaxID=45398 RepID=A0A918LA68_STRGD|nr:hypothetical protein [Streptomyces niveoruber]GGS23500.1 hypothetical protein GCM10010238_09400 [Streptomyces niveoruber]
MEHTDRPAQPQQREQDRPDDLDWFRQEPRLPSVPQADADPVRTVWHLSRFHLGSRRYTGRVDNALVCVTRKGTYETFLPPDRPTSVRRYVALYEVDTDPHSFQLSVPLPSSIDSFEFEATADVTWRVTHPARFVRSQERDVPGLLTRELLPVMRDAGRRHPQDAEAAAERSVRLAVAEATGIGAREGLQVAFSVRLRRDATERSHQARLRTARHEAEAARPEHEASLLREMYEAERRSGQIDFYESVLAKGGTAALALHLAAHPDETRLVLDHLQAGQDKLLGTQMELITHVLESKRLEDHQLNEPHELIAERMKAILRTEPLSESEALAPGHSGGAGPEPGA